MLGLGCDEQPVPISLTGRAHLRSVLFLAGFVKMRVAIFFDGKNFYSGWRANASRVKIASFSRLAEWLVAQARGSYLAGAYYYTGIETGTRDAEGAEGQRRLAGFLDILETQPGFFVFRFPRKVRQHHCPSCGATSKFTTEKEVDTTLVADMLRLAAVNAFDIAVVVSGDADLAPAVEGVRGLGKQVYVATWGGSGLAQRIRKAAFDHVDLLQGIDAFAGPDTSLTGTITPSSDGEVEEIFLAELIQAQARFADGYVGVNYFLTKWRSDRLSDNAGLRQRILDRLVSAERVGIYTADTGDQAMRLVGREPEPIVSLGVHTATSLEAAIEEASAQLASADPVPSGADAEAVTATRAGTTFGDAEIEGCLQAIQDAEQHFGAGYLGYNYFLTKWRTSHVTDDVAQRERLVELLMNSGKVEIYYSNGTRALRTTPG